RISRTASSTGPFGVARDPCPTMGETSSDSAASPSIPRPSTTSSSSPISRSISATSLRTWAGRSGDCATCRSVRSPHGTSRAERAAPGRWASSRSSGGRRGRARRSEIPARRPTDGGRYCPIVSDRSPAGTPHPSYVPFTSNAYVAEPETEVEESTAAWLEEQAEMPFIREVAQRSFELMDLRPGDAVVDVGCGTGVMLPALTNAVGPDGSVTGIDHSAAFLARAQRRLTEAGLEHRVALVRGDAQALPFEDATFDVAHVERLLMHLAEPDAAIRELLRVTRPGGRIVCAEVHANGADVENPDRHAMDLINQAAIAQIRNPAMGIELRRRLVDAGLESVRVAAV